MTKQINTQKRLIGAHVSTAGGTHFAIDRATELGANAIQIFSGSPRLWKRPDPSNIDRDTLFSKQSKSAVKKIFIHALYLVNLASDNEAQIKKSIDALQAELKVASHIKSSGVIVHVGSQGSRDWAEVREGVATRIKEILDNTPSDSIFLIENSAGQNGKVCSDLEEIRWLIDKVGSKRLKWCLDTCHAFAAGYDLTGDSQTEGKNGPSRGSLIKEISRLGLWKELTVIHVNDSKGKFHSGIDRHQNLGDGEIGKDTFVKFLNDKNVIKIPLILEVPGLDGKGPDKANMERLTKMVK